MIFTVSNGGFVKKDPKTIYYRDFSKYDKKAFKRDLQENLSNSDRNKFEYGAFDNIVDNVLNDHAPLKNKTVRANDSPFMTKSLRKAIMTRTRVRNRYNKLRTDENWKAFKKQRNKWVELLREAKNYYYGNLSLKLLTANRNFWRTVKPLFSDKIQTSIAITLLENDELVNDNNVVANIFNNYFVRITDSLNIPALSENLVPTNEIIDPLDIALTKYKFHPSIKRIKEGVQVEQRFEFKHVSLQEVVVQLHKLNPKKSCPVGSLPTRLLKEHFEVFGVGLLNLINNSLNTGLFPDKLKMGEVSSLFKTKTPSIRKTVGL